MILWGTILLFNLREYWVGELQKLRSEWIIRFCKIYSKAVIWVPWGKRERKEWFNSTFHFQNIEFCSFFIHGLDYNTFKHAYLCPHRQWILFPHFPYYTQNISPPPPSCDSPQLLWSHSLTNQLSKVLEIIQRDYFKEI